MSHAPAWAWVVLFFLGAFHGINPGMGWLFAVALGMQRRSGAAVWQSLLPLAAGHALSIGLVIAGAIVVGAVVPATYVRISVACVLLGFGLYRLLRRGHPSWGGMQVDFRDLTIWSFLMASAHGAGFMLLPVVMGALAGHGLPNAQMQESHMHDAHTHDIHAHELLSFGPWTGVLAVAAHTLGYLVTTGALAFVVYKWFGLSLLRKAWLNLDLVWAVALIASAGATLVW